MSDFRFDEFSLCTKFSAKIEKIRRGERKRVKEIQYPRPPYRCGANRRCINNESLQLNYWFPLDLF